MFSSDQTLVLPAGKTAVAIGTGPLSKVAATSDTITLIFCNEYVQISLHEGEEIILGRVHPTNQIQPQVDLTSYGAAGCGTSRLHATIRHENGKWWIKDLGSSNGSWLNGERLAPFCPRALDTRNHLQLANLEVRVVLPEVARVA
jgi:pSer/pThr/pTyr-binding forkhead associated (FHA) protein